ncbi:DUF2264 domain-containing protein [Sphingobacterium sp. SYP-B4668]|uniref:DUF2264 domain-containing protein n=1 Tax=Sphingobacterium sp. SYP-B4668 TaxID=2996035 RepID=UPI0022DE1512|nr:DUF2264 domain-containing protein [Sphingobacterium sp. SYP-B4668]
MERRILLKLLATIGLGVVSSPFSVDAKVVDQSRGIEKGNDRAYWVSVLDKMAAPILDNISEQQLRKRMPMLVSPTFDSRDPGVGYLEAFGRLLSGMAPWLALPDDETVEGKLRQKRKKQALLGIQYGVTPTSPDYFTWNKSSQPLVDAAYLVQSFMRAPKALWDPLPVEVKANVTRELIDLRRIKPNESNWLLFAAMVESFLYKIGVDCVREKIDYAIQKFDKDWYVGDGWYSDGNSFSFDHYNGYVIHAMLVDVLRENLSADAKYRELYDRAYKRMQRYGHHLERMISPEGYFLVVGRSSTYRTAAFQPLAQLIWDEKLPEGLTYGQLRAALTAVKRHVYVEQTFDKSGWLTMGLVGDEQANLADYYTNAGSMYITSTSFLPLGLPADHLFWTTAAEKWTSQKAWSGERFAKDYYVNY